MKFIKGVLQSVFIQVLSTVFITILGIGCVLQDFPTQYCKEKVHTFAPEIFL